MKVFWYGGEVYIRVIPAKSLMKSTMVYEVITRGDVFALRIRDSQLTIIKGTAKVVHYDDDSPGVEVSQADFDKIQQVQKHYAEEEYTLFP